MIISLALTAAIVIIAVVSCRRKEPLVYTFEKSDPNELLARGNKFFMEEQTDSALIYYTMAMGKYKPGLDSEMKMACAKASQNAGALYLFYKFDYAAAYSCLLDALEIAEECGDSTINAPIYLNIGNIWLNYKDDERMAEHFRKAFDFAVKSGDDESALISITTLMAYAIEKDSIEAVKKDMEAFDTLKLRDEKGAEAVRVLREGVRTLESGDHMEAVRLIREAGKSDDVSFSHGRFNLFCDEQAVNVLKRIGRNRDAIDIARAPALSDSAPLDIRVLYCKTLSDLYRIESIPDSSGWFSRLGVQLHDSLYREQQYSRIRDIKEDKALKKLDTKLTMAETERRRTVTILWCVCGMTIVTLLFLYVLYRQNRALTQRNVDLFRLYNEVMAAEAKERRMREEYETLLASKEKDGSGVPEEVGMSKESKEEGCKDRETKPRLEKSMHFEILSKITDVLSDEAEIRSDDFSLTKLVVLTGVNAHYISEVINQEYGKSFSTLLGEMRVAIVCRMLDDDENFGHLTLEAIGAEAGFKSRSNFVSVFKKTTGLTPSQYRKIAVSQRN